MSCPSTTKHWFCQPIGWPTGTNGKISPFFLLSFHFKFWYNTDESRTPYLKWFSLPWPHSFSPPPIPHPPLSGAIGLPFFPLLLLLFFISYCWVFFFMWTGPLSVWNSPRVCVGVWVCDRVFKRCASICHCLNFYVIVMKSLYWEKCDLIALHCTSCSLLLILALETSAVWISTVELCSYFDSFDFDPIKKKRLENISKNSSAFPMYYLYMKLIEREHSWRRVCQL